MKLVKMRMFLRGFLTLILLWVNGGGGAAWPVQAQTSGCFNRVSDSAFDALTGDWIERSLPEEVDVDPDPFEGEFFPLPIVDWDGSVGAVMDYNAPAGPNSGEWWAWFGQGISNTLPITQVMQSIEQDVIIPTGTTASLEFNLWISRADVGTGAGDWLQVKMGDTAIFTATGAFTTPYAAGYTPVRINVTPFATGALTTLTISATTRAAQNGLPPVINFNVDDVAVCASYPVYLPLVRK